MNIKLFDENYIKKHPLTAGYYVVHYKELNEPVFVLIQLKTFPNGKKLRVFDAVSLDYCEIADSIKDYIEEIKRTYNSDVFLSKKLDFGKYNPKKEKNSVYYWQCNWDNGKGCFHADFERCTTKSRQVFKTVLEAAIDGKNHNHHDGYDSNCTSVVGRRPNGKEKFIGYCKLIANGGKYEN